MNIFSSSALSAVVAFAVTALLGFVLIPILHKLKFGQTILVDIGPKWHAKKQGTPTMGGFMFIIGVILAVAVAALTCMLTDFSLFSEFDFDRNKEITKLWGGILFAVCFALIGFADDYIKVVKKRNLGLTEIQKTIPQLIAIAAYLSGLWISGGQNDITMFVPFVGNVRMGWFFWIFGICVIYGAINAVNFTDGVDGLCGSVTLTAGVALAVIAMLREYTSMTILSCALVGACAGYLIWNHYPAKVMMGDTGSMFLGGIVVAIAYGLDCPIILLPVGIIYVIEAMSDVIQIGSIKLRHKKVFLMAPIHHHFEMKGWKETKVVAVFTAVNIIGGIIGVLLMYFGGYKI